MSILYTDVYVQWPLLLPRVVLGFNVHVSGPRKVFEYLLPLRSDSSVNRLRVKDGVAYVEYKAGGIGVDVVDLGERAISRFRVGLFF